MVVSLRHENRQKVQAKIHQYTLNFTLQLKANCFELCCFQTPKTKNLLIKRPIRGKCQEKNKNCQHHYIYNVYLCRRKLTVKKAFPKNKHN